MKKLVALIPTTGKSKKDMVDAAVAALKKKGLLKEEVRQ
jgi:hypothetical protein